jgi:hypothetical protein
LTLDRSVVLFNNVVQIFGLTDFDVCVVLRVVALDRRGVGATTFVEGDLRRSAVLVDRLA